MTNQKLVALREHRFGLHPGTVKGGALTHGEKISGIDKVLIHRVSSSESSPLEMSEVGPTLSYPCWSTGGYGYENVRSHPSLAIDRQV